ncbi:MAG: flagellar assembly protein FliH [Cycloclasticus sp.]|nr:flagellar assembly protein FliH [Cycloclasticus sp.]
MSKSPSKIEDVTSWEFPSFAGSTSVDVDLGKVKVPTAGDLEKLQQQVTQEAAKKGYEEGFAKGLKASEAQIKQKVTQLESVLQAMQDPFDEFDERVENEIAALAIQIARQLIRREIKFDSGQVIAVVKEALAALPSSSQNIQLFLHPEDARLVVSALSLGQADDTRWKVIEDPVLSRGGCRVVTDVSTIDATIENRLSVIIAQALGDERAAP